MVLRSEFSGVKRGDYLYGILRERLTILFIARIKHLLMRIPLEAFQNYVIKNDLNSLRVFENPYKLPWSTFIGVLGMPGKYSG